MNQSARAFKLSTILVYTNYFYPAKNQQNARHFQKFITLITLPWLFCARLRAVSLLLENPWEKNATKSAKHSSVRASVTGKAASSAGFGR